MLPFEDYRAMGGSVEDENLYARLSARAGQIIHRATHGRLRGKDPPEEVGNPQDSQVSPEGLTPAAQIEDLRLWACVRNCAYELIELLAADRSADAMLGGIAAGRDVASVSNDGVSVNFATGGSGSGAGGSSGSLQARCLGLVREWLDGATDADGVHLLYGGIDA